MLNQSGYRALTTLDAYTIQFFCRFLADADLSVYRILDPIKLAGRYHLKADVVMNMIDSVERVGLIERGPETSRGSRGLATYRIRRTMRLSGQSLMEWETTRVTADDRMNAMTSPIK